MICLICRQAEIIAGSTLVTFERGEFRLVMTGVPARICPSCGEAYLEEAITEQILRFARQKHESGIIDARYEYGTLYL
jgi:YgiT-type zinc finger domain-containing protein